MAQRTIDDPASLEYTQALDELWAGWEPSMRRVERLLAATRHGSVHLGFHEPHELFSAAQYRAHETSERCVGLIPPLVAFEAHRYLVEVLGYCRDTLGAMALASEFDTQIDAEAGERGLRALLASREAYQAAQYASYATLNHPHGFFPTLTEPAEGAPPRWMTLTMSVAGAVSLASSLFVLLLLGPGQ